MIPNAVGYHWSTEIKLIDVFRTCTRYIWSRRRAGPPPPFGQCQNISFIIAVVYYVNVKSENKVHKTFDLKIGAIE